MSIRNVPLDGIKRIGGETPFRNGRPPCPRGGSQCAAQIELELAAEAAGD